MSQLGLSCDELLSTTRAVRKRLDFSKPVPDNLVRECISLALQAPSGSNEVTMRFIVVRDPSAIAAIADVYAQCWKIYETFPMFAGAIKRDTDEHQAQQDRVTSSATYLAEHMAECPVLVIGAASGGRIEGAPAIGSASVLGNILPAMWNFMLAARADRKSVV